METLNVATGAEFQRSNLPKMGERLFLKLKKDGAHMTPTEIDALITRWMAAEVSTIEDLLADTPKPEDWYEGAGLDCRNQN
jgi:hypothetical protein